jgi:TonB-linked SusC/RagA family outer membrane protein
MKIILAFLLVVHAISVFAQETRITGRVVDANGIPLPGVTVMIVGTSKGTTTDIEGAYSINVLPTEELQFRFIGYIQQFVAPQGRERIDIVMIEDAMILEEFVVIGYGVQRKADLTTAVSVIDEDDIRNRPLASAIEAIQGRAPGVQVVQPSGEPGGDFFVRVRGATSVIAGNDPLYVVDGVPTTNIRGLNPNDISSISILKDASSAAIYGARAANGVVLITTNRGRAGESLVQYNSFFGISNLRRPIEVLNTRHYRDLMNEILPGAMDPADTDFNDWSDIVFGTGIHQSHQFSFSGGTENLQHFISAAYQSDAGIVAPARFDRYSVRLNLDNQPREWLKLTTSINVLSMRTKDTPDNLSSGRGGVIMSTLNTPPFLGIYNEDGSGQFDPNPFQPSWENPVAYMEGPEQLSVDNNLFGNITAQATVIPGLDVTTRLGVEANNHQWDYYLDPFRTNFGRNNNGLGRSSKTNNRTLLWESTGSFARTFALHSISGLVGASIQRHISNNSFLEGRDFPENVNVTTLNSANIITGGTWINEWALASFFGRVAYNFDSRYFITASVRRDGSSKLAHHWGTMPSFSLGWRISSEPFMQGLNFIDNMMIRGGWGRSGNQEGISNYARFGLINYHRRTATNPMTGPAAVQVTYGNPDLRWETTDQTNIGFDLSMFNNRVTVNADAYYKRTDDVLLNVQLSATLPITTIQTNAGSIENKGLELNVNTVNVDKNWKWNTDFNISANRNKVLRLDYTSVYYFGRIYSNNQDVAIVREGLPLGSFFGYISDGVDPATGNLIFRDINNNGIFDPGDRTVIGNGQPDFIFGLNNHFSFNRFDLNIFFQGSFGNDIFNATRIDLEGMFDSKNQSVNVLRRWKQPGDITDIPRSRNMFNVNNSSRFVEDGSYIRLKSITLSYRLLDNNPRFQGIRNLSVFVTGRNLLTFTNYSGFDPEVNAFGNSAVELGIDYGTYPQSRSIVFGINVEF